MAYAREMGEVAAPTVATEVEGLRLHVSSKSSTGYKGVYYQPRQVSRPYRAVRPEDNTQIGLFATAAEAAVAYAKVVGEA